MAWILVPNALVAGAMLGVGFIATGLAGLDASYVFRPYVQTYAAVTLICALGWLFLAAVRLAIARAEAPLPALAQMLRPKLPLLLLPALVAPLFLSGYTMAKTSMSRLIAFRWDALFTNMDHWIFGTDPWQITHAWIGPSATGALETFYTFVWGGALVFAQALVALNGSRRLVGRFFLAMSLAWMIGGVVLAYVFSSAGPVFAGHFDASLADRFAALQQVLDRTLAEDSSIRRTQAYLFRELGLAFVAKGGGISAMPSMHMATASLFVLAARGTRWLTPALLFFLLTFIGSVHFGYHYAVDMPLAVLVTLVCWKAAGMFYARERLRFPNPVRRQPA